jgi:bifunctional DNA-binding transcriptional regulator/antitoxin component of YhaV-PrlF toxin-antitoxin module
VLSELEAMSSNQPKNKREEKLMKSTGIVRCVDDLGRIGIPREIRRILTIKEGAPMELFIMDGMVCLKRFYAKDGYMERINDLLAVMNDDTDMENSVEIKSKLNEALELLSDRK